MRRLRGRSCVLAVTLGVALAGCASRMPVASAPPSAPPSGAAVAPTSKPPPWSKPEPTPASAPASIFDDLEPFDALSALAFPSAAHGVLLSVYCGAGSARCAAEAFTSTDAGLTWSAPTVLGDVTRTPDENPYGAVASNLTFVDETTGYAYGPDLFRTTDGGRTWQRLGVSGAVQAVVRVDGRTWVVRSPCPPDSAGTSGCGSVIDVLGEGDALTPLAAQPAPGGTVVQTVATHTAVYAIVRVDETFGIRVSADAGARWASLPLPLPCRPGQPGGMPTSLAAAGGRLWIVCGGDMGGGAEAKSLFISDDGGHTWRQPGSLEDIGYADQVVAISATTAWRFGARAHAYLSTDGGRTWTPRLPDVFNGAVGPPNGWAFVGTDRAWLLDGVGGYASEPHRLYVTGDGGASWTTVTLPAASSNGMLAPSP